MEFWIISAIALEQISAEETAVRESTTAFLIHVSMVLALTDY